MNRTLPFIGYAGYAFSLLCLLALLAVIWWLALSKGLIAQGIILSLFLVASIVILGLMFLNQMNFKEGLICVATVLGGFALCIISS